MYVSRLQMTGFKSFADTTTIELEPGIAAVVGPNGCGKTNICDAIRWVLGEENVRVLRGSRTEDVIFAGTGTRKPTGLAEVSLTLSDVQGVLPVEYNDVTVTRRAFRSGESEFFINKAPCRLKDIVDLFMGTGMGRRAYSVMERDMIDWILDDTSGQRRKIVEEAAGVSKYKSRRKETLGKLELTQRDLERVQDLIGEVERRVRQLARQAAKARRYERLTQRIKEVETSGAVKEYQAMCSRRADLERQAEAVEIEMTDRGTEIAVREAEIENLRLAVIEIESEINEHGRRLAEKAQDAQRLESERIMLAERERSTGEKADETARDIEARRASLGEKGGLLKAKQEQVEACSVRLEELRLLAREVEAQYTRAERELKAKRDQSMLSARERLTTIKKTVDAASRLAEVRSRRSHLEESIQRAASRRASVVCELERIGGAIDAARAEAQAANLRVEREENQLATLVVAIEDVRVKVDRIREERARLAEEEARASSKHDVLKEMVERYEGFETGVRALMSDRGGAKGIHGVVGDIVRCKEARFEPAVATALASALQYVVIENREHARDSVRMLKDEKKGPATLVMLESVRGADVAASAGAVGEGVVGRITDFVECEPRYRAVVDYLLGDFFIVEDLDRAFSLCAVGGADGRSYVTPDGDGLFKGSIVRAGSNGATSGALIGRREKLADLAREAEALRSLSLEQEKAFEELRASLAEMERDRENRRRLLEEAKAGLAEIDQNLKAKIAERAAHEKTREQLDSEIAHLRGLADAAGAEAAETAARGGHLDIEQVPLFEEVEDQSGLESEVAELARRRDEAGAEMLTLGASKAYLDETVARLGEEVRTLGEEIENLERRGNELEAMRAELGRGQTAVESEVSKMVAVLDDMERQRNTAVESKKEAEATIDDARRAVKAAQAAREECLTRKQSIQSELNLIGVKTEGLRRRMLDEFEVDLETTEAAGLEAVENPEEELHRLRAFLRGLGPVNLVALDEFDVEKQRYDFLKTQRDDLTKARESLDEAIVQINKRARTDFAEIFERVRRDFRRNFQTLFEGGDADLRLEDPSDPLESPVEIFAQPSGKKLEHISLLSGGERALTAIAFLFAVYYTKPSPFCLLDEVDAPLDDSNVARYVNLVKSLSERTQFLMVTHNKRTMEAGSCLYGVTMEEAGVSRMVSVKLERAQDALVDAARVG